MVSLFQTIEYVLQTDVKLTHLKALRTQISVLRLIFLRCCRILLFSSLRVLSRSLLDWWSIASLMLDKIRKKENWGSWKKIRKIPIIFYIENWLWITTNSDFFHAYTGRQNVWSRWPVSEVKCLSMFQRVGMRKGGLPVPQAFQYLNLMTWRAYDLDLVMVYSLALKWQGLKVGMPVFQLFYEMKLKTSKFKVLAFLGQWRYHDKIQITSSSCHKNQVLKS